MQQQRLRIKEFLAKEELRLAPSCGSAFEASVVEMLGFDAIHLSGQAIHKSLALADIGLMTLTELEGRLASINEAIDIPVIVDGETGFGSERNIRRTVRLLERAGASAIHFEDQVTPRRPRAGSNVPTISTKQMIAKLEAALEERSDPNMAIIARCEDRTSDEIIIERLTAYAKCGVDALWSSSGFGKNIIAPVREAAGGIPFIGIPANRSIKQETVKLGVRVMVIPSITMAAAAWGIATVLRKVRDVGSPDETYRHFDGLDEIREWIRDLGEDRYSIV